MKTSFTDYLKTKELTNRTITTVKKVVNIFLQWLKKEQLEATQVRYQDILSFMKHCQKQGATQRTVQNYLNMIKHFYDHLIDQEQIENNPVTGIKIQGVKRKSLYHIFKPQELHAIYNSYQDESLKGKRN
jgi:integrase/recombinase XerD